MLTSCDIGKLKKSGSVFLIAQKTHQFFILSCDFRCAKFFLLPVSMLNYRQAVLGKGRWATDAAEEPLKDWLAKHQQATGHSRWRPDHWFSLGSYPGSALISNWWAEGLRVLQNKPPHHFPPFNYGNRKETARLLRNDNVLWFWVKESLNIVFCKLKIKEPINTFFFPLLILLHFIISKGWLRLDSFT